MPNFVPSIPNLVSNEENECLISTVASNEIENVGKQMASDKALGQMDFNHFFFLKFLAHHQELHHRCYQGFL